MINGETIIIVLWVIMNLFGRLSMFAISMITLTITKNIFFIVSFHHMQCTPASDVFFIQISPFLPVTSLKIIHDGIFKKGSLSRTPLLVYQEWCTSEEWKIRLQAASR